MRACILLPLLASAAAAACQLDAALDLGRTVSRDSIAVTVPFTPGKLSEASFNGYTFRINDYCVGEHTGTHLDSPFHFDKSGWTVAEIPLERLVANAVFLNLTDETAGNSSFRMEPRHIEQWVMENGDFPDNAILIISYGWAQHHANRSAYLGTASINFFDYRYPGLSKAAAQELAKMKNIVGIAVDNPSIDPPGSGEAHILLAANNVYNLEHVNLDQDCLPARGFKVLSMPMKIAGGTGAPARVVAVPDWQRPR